MDGGNKEEQSGLCSAAVVAAAAAVLDAFVHFHLTKYTQQLSDAAATQKTEGQVTPGCLHLSSALWLLTDTSPEDTAGGPEPLQNNYTDSRQLLQSAQFVPAVHLK